MLLLLFSLCGYAQKKGTVELSVSGNYSTVGGDNTENRLGFGAGVYYLFRAERKINLFSGFEYNMTSQFKKQMYESRSSYATDLTYYFHNLSIPLAVRFNIGNSFKFFVETGAFIDLFISGRRKGYANVSDVRNMIMKQISINEKVDMNSVNYGPSLGIGTIIPIKSYGLLIKLDYKWGIQELYSYHYDRIFNSYLRLGIGLQM